MKTKYKIVALATLSALVFVLVALDTPTYRVEYYAGRGARGYGETDWYYAPDTTALAGRAIAVVAVGAIAALAISIGSQETPWGSAMKPKYKVVLVVALLLVTLAVFFVAIDESHRENSYGAEWYELDAHSLPYWITVIGLAATVVGVAISMDWGVWRKLTYVPPPGKDE